MLYILLHSTDCKKCAEMPWSTNTRYRTAGTQIRPHMTHFQLPTPIVCRCQVTAGSPWLGGLVLSVKSVWPPQYIYRAPLFSNRAI